MKKAAGKTLAVLVLLALLSTSFSGCGRDGSGTPVSDNCRVFYEIFVGSFSDSDGDGTGDIRGIINRMDYLNDGDTSSGKSLGVEGLWLSPIFSSPSYHKYDASDYYKIDEKFGTEEDLKELLKICHERNVKVIIDLALNHSSDESRKFAMFCGCHKSKSPAAEYYNYYSFVKGADRQGGHTYRLIKGTEDDWYECNFSEDMPEINYDCEAAREEAVNIAKYWLDLGVDGFRFDAIKYIYYGETKRNVEFWDWYCNELRKTDPDIYLVGECWSGDPETLEYINALNCFDFQMAQPEGFIAATVRGSDISVFTNYIESYQAKIEEKRGTTSNNDAMMISFISNHDMDRSAGYLMLANRWPQMAANLYLLAPGSPFIYYGEEIGAKGTRGSVNTDANRRLAMNWGDGDTVEDPQGTTYEKKKQTNGTVAQHLQNEDSLFNYYRRVIALRSKYPQIGRGSYKAVVFGEKKFGGFEITCNEEKTWLFHNTSDSDITVDLCSGTGYKETPEFEEICDLIGQGTAVLEGTVLTVGPFTSVIIR